MNVSLITSSVGAATQPLREAAEFSSQKVRGVNSSEDRKKVAAQFEAVLVRQLLSKSVGGMLGGSDNVAGTVYGDMMTDALAQKLTAGTGLGLGRFIEKQLTPRGVPADFKEDQKPAAAQPPDATKAHS
jgi:Rod binding domain-containing protein